VDLLLHCVDDLATAQTLSYSRNEKNDMAAYGNAGGRRFIYLAVFG